MKKTLPILSCFVISYAFSQNNFIVSVGTPGQDMFSSVTEVAGGYIGTGYASLYNIPVYKIDKNGQFVSNATIVPNDPNSGGRAIVNTSDGGFAVSGYKYTGTHTSMGIFKFDSAGSLQWTKQYDEGGDAIGEILLQTDDKGFLIAGELYNPFPYSLGYLVKTDSAGNPEWSKKFVNVTAFNGLQKTKDKNYILLSGYNTDSSISVIKVDPAGNILWSKSFISSANEILLGSGILALSDGGYLITEYHHVFKLDALGNIQWSKVINAGDNHYAELYDAIETGSKSYVLGGDYDLDYYLVKIDSVGTVLWTKVFSDGGDELIRSIQKLIATSDGGYLGAGHVQGDWAFLKFDSAFNTCTPTQNLGGLQNFIISYKNKTISATAGNAVTYNETVSLGPFGSLISTCGVLPVNLIAFDIIQQNESVLLNWQTAFEQNNPFFAIERSNNGNSFKEIGKVNSKGNSDKIQQYSFEDLNPLNGGNYYRLRQVDADGKTTYSKVVFIDFNKKIAIKLYPNPAKDILTLQRLNANIKTTISIIGLQGSTLMKATTTGNTYTWNIKHLPPGIYYVKIESDKNVSILKFVKD